uniref:cytochrome c biogenesis protein ResB n=1 Tax=Segatella buccae TaxID=28126 RepID=UPI0006613438
ARRGAIHLRQGQSTAEYMAAKDGQGMEPARLPFKVKLEKFNIRYHEGTKAAADYESIISIGGDGPANRYTVSMNRIASHGGVRLYQSSYDEDGRGSVLAINSDPYGIPVTYVGSR